MNITMRKSIYLIGSLLLLQGCISAPPEVSASIPLIKNQKVYAEDLLSEDFSNKVERAAHGDTLLYQGNTLLIGKEYTSALGLNCKSVRVFEQNYTAYNSTICMTQAGWYMASSLNVKSPATSTMEVQ